jgi:5-methylcytosine-specific restriction endonuclease McrA
VDTLANVQTLCPSCHREKTYGHEHLKNFGEPGMPG